jgi:hypothetical protein
MTPAEVAELFQVNVSYVYKVLIRLRTTGITTALPWAQGRGLSSRSRMPGATLLGNVLAILLAGALPSVFQRQPTLTSMPCSQMSQALISSSVASEISATCRRSAS